MIKGIITSSKSISQDVLAGLKRRHWKQDIMALVLFLAATVGWQLQTGAYKSEFGGHPDEAAHYVTGLMIRDYLTGGIPEHPMKFARNYYDHYPKVALGNWPPFFYIAQSAWTIPFGPSRTSLMIFMAFLTAGTALLIFNEVRHQSPNGLALAAGLIYCSLPVVQKFSSHVMTEALLAFLATLAICLFARYLNSGQTRYSLAFGLVASCAILTKGSGMFLAFVPLAGVLGSRKFPLLKKPGFWASALIVILLCAPWTLATLNLAKAGWESQSPNLAFTLQAIPYYWKKLFLTTGVVMATMVPLLICLVRSLKTSCSALEASAIGFFLATMLLQPIIPCGLEPRHLVIALPVLLLFLPDTVRCLEKHGMKPNHLALILVAAAVLQPLERKPKECFGFRDSARLAIQDPVQTTLFVSSDASGEGMFISEVAMAEDRPGHIVKRSSKVFATVNWSGSDYQSDAKSTVEVLAIFEKEGISIITLDDSMEPDKNKTHHRLIEETVKKHPEHFEEILSNDALRKGRTYENAVRTYRFKSLND